MFNECYSLTSFPDLTKWNKTEIKGNFKDYIHALIIPKNFYPKKK